ncbi:hypothetical protein DFH07DRAFT_962494 [Mycena maculata]|uniref:Uncharacterized protein n=1 Tax=Mycena maculata TaxID=230809 RepID=A0AAD7N6B0_9AGAR|nr:hypothetical protein DFH07DRAFT_962494 [Mycena maculata]
MLEATAQLQSELEYVQQELRKAREERDALKEKVSLLQTAEQNARHEIKRLEADAEVSEATNARLVSTRTKQVACIREANAQIDSLPQENDGLRETAQKYETRSEATAAEQASLKSQLRQRPPSGLRAESGDPISLDPYENHVDQASEADIKSGVESLNDSLDAFTMTIIDEAEELAGRHSRSRVASVVQQHNTRTKLIAALAEYSEVEDKRGFFLEANLHHGLVVELNKLFFSGDVLSRAQSSCLTTALLDDLAKHHPWTVVQRWRSLTATSGANLVSSSSKIWKDSISCSADSTVTLLAWAHCQPLETFTPLLPTIQNRLASLYDEASRISVIVRRDLLSVRMSVIAPDQEAVCSPFEPDIVNGAWPDMGVAAGDEVIGFFKFGLRRQTEKGEVSHLIKPEVTTSALLRYMADKTS